MRVGDSLRRTVAERANEQCEYCQYPEQFSPSSFEVEHIVPKSAGGLTEPNNLALACSHCNAHKATRQTGIDPLTGTNVRLFNPRIDDWAVHFLLNQKTGEIEGQTSTGRSTVEVLMMNAEQPTRARRNLIRLEVL
ncbi:MAG: HNH endonuclease signature motif containing protein [Candidatus Poribacteria bacterium]|nr:HNH endonuclease signature motif containing protein [Candidatus Poribacteria bacterium]